MLLVDHDIKSTSDVFKFQAFVHGMGSCLIVCSAYHKNTNDKVERANGVIGNTLCRDASTPTGARTAGICSCPSLCLPSTTRLQPWATDFIDRGAHPPSRPPLSVATDSGTGVEFKLPVHYARRMHNMELTVH